MLTEWDLVRIILHFYPKTENMFFKVEESLWILIDSPPKPKCEIKWRCTTLANFHFHHTRTHNPTCTALIIFKINFSDYFLLFQVLAQYIFNTRSCSRQTRSTPHLPWIFIFVGANLFRREQIRCWSLISQSWKNFPHKDKKSISCQLIKNWTARWPMFEKVRRRLTKNFKLIPQEPQSRAFQPSPEYTILFLVKIRNWAAVPK